MFEKLSGANRRKMILYTFLYYPLALIVGLSIAVAVLKYVGLMNEVPVWYVIIMLIIGIGISIHNLSQIYRDLLRKDGHKDQL
jgi:predicted RND superfamily exporter protein